MVVSFQQRVPSVPAVLRGRLLLLALLTVTGSPWVQRPRLHYYVEYAGQHPHDGAWTKFLLLAAGGPAWESSPRFYGGVGYMFTNGLWTLLLFAGVATLPSRLPARMPGWARRVAGAILAAELANLLWWAAPMLFLPPTDTDIWYAGRLLAGVTGSGLVFGLLAGGLLALLSAGSAGPAGPAGPAGSGERARVTSTDIDTARSSWIARRKGSPT